MFPLSSIAMPDGVSGSATSTPYRSSHADLSEPSGRVRTHPQRARRRSGSDSRGAGEGGERDDGTRFVQEVDAVQTSLEHTDSVGALRDADRADRHEQHDERVGDPSDVPRHLVLFLAAPSTKGEASVRRLRLALRASAPPSDVCRASRGIHSVGFVGSATLGDGREHHPYP